MWNRTPKASKNATESVPRASLFRRRPFYPFVVVLLGIFFAGAALYVLQGTDSSYPDSSDCVHLGSGDRNEDACVKLEVVRDDMELKKGLSGRVSLPDDEGMLFDFGGERTRCMWMKDMHIPLDMIWLDEGGTVLDIETNVLPETYPETFCGQGAARYVIEMNAGLVETSGVTVGQQIQL